MTRELENGQRWPWSHHRKTLTDQHLYAMGGRVDANVVQDIQQYNFQTNEWTVMATSLPHPVHKHAACVLQDCIYISGGKHTAGGEDTNQVHCLDLSTNTWTPKAPMLQATSCHKFMGLDAGKDNRTVVLFVLTNDLQMQLYYSDTDHWVLRNLGMGVPFKPNTNSSLLASSNQLWLLNMTLHVPLGQLPLGQGYDVANLTRYGVCLKGVYDFKNRKLMLANVLQKFPLYVVRATENEAPKDYFCAMLSVPLYTCKAGETHRPRAPQSALKSYVKLKYWIQIP